MNTEQQPIFQQGWFTFHNILSAATAFMVGMVAFSTFQISKLYSSSFTILIGISDKNVGLYTNRIFCLSQTSFLFGGLITQLIKSFFNLGIKTFRVSLIAVLALETLLSCYMYYILQFNNHAGLYFLLAHVIAGLLRSFHMICYGVLFTRHVLLYKISMACNILFYLLASALQKCFNIGLGHKLPDVSSFLFVWLFCCISIFIATFILYLIYFFLCDDPYTEQLNDNTDGGFKGSGYFAKLISPVMMAVIGFNIPLLLEPTFVPYEFLNKAHSKIVLFFSFFSDAVGSIFILLLDSFTNIKDGWVYSGSAKLVLMDMCWLILLFIICILSIFLRGFHYKGGMIGKLLVGDLFLVSILISALSFSASVLHNIGVAGVKGVSLAKIPNSTPKIQISHNNCEAVCKCTVIVTSDTAIEIPLESKLSLCEQCNFTELNKVPHDSNSLFSNVKIVELLDNMLSPRNVYSVTTCLIIFVAIIVTIFSSSYLLEFRNHVEMMKLNRYYEWPTESRSIFYSIFYWFTVSFRHMVKDFTFNFKLELDD